MERPDNNTLPGPADDEINLLDLLKVLVKRKMLIIKVCTVAVVVAVIISLLLPNIFTATARVLPPQKDTGGGGLSALLGQMGGLAGLAGGMGGLGGTGELYVGILKSRSVADAVIKRLDLMTHFKAKNADDARRGLAGVVKSQLGKDGIITITAESKDPKQAADLANAMVEELGKRSVQLNLTKAGIERGFLEKRIDLVKQDLKRAEENLKLFAERNKTVKVESQATATIAEVAKLKAEIASKEVQLAALRSYQTDESPEVQALKSAVAKLQSHLRTGEGGGDGGSIPSVGKIPGLGLDYARLLREVKVQEAIFEQLTKQYEAAKLVEAKDSSSLQVLDDAVVPNTKSKPKRSLIVILAAMGAFAVGVFVAFMQEYFEKMDRDDRGRWEEIKEHLRIRRRSA